MGLMKCKCLFQLTEHVVFDEKDLYHCISYPTERLEITAISSFTINPRFCIFSTRTNPNRGLLFLRKSRLTSPRSWMKRQIKTWR